MRTAASRAGLYLIVSVVAMAGAGGGHASGVTFTSPVVISESDATYDGENIIVDGTAATIDGAHTFAGVSIINGGKITTSETTASAEYSLDLTVIGSLLIDAGGSIDVSARGYLGGNRPGNSGNRYGKTLGNVDGSYYRSGGGYGGLGGKLGVDARNDIYGDPLEPDELGSGGGGRAGYNQGGDGGGLIRISASTIQLNGSIKADGGDGTDGTYYAGGGSGGGIRIHAGSLIGDGSIGAGGGDGGGNFGCGGGGGRIAVYYSNTLSLPPANITATGGSGAEPGHDGTVFFGVPGDLNGDCTVNILDLLIVRNHLGLDPASGENRKADLNADGVINILDLIRVRNVLGTVCP
jgi:hypothetical protein